MCASGVYTYFSFSYLSRTFSVHSLHRRGYVEKHLVSKRTFKIIVLSVLRKFGL